MAHAHDEVIPTNAQYCKLGTDDHWRVSILRRASALVALEVSRHVAALSFCGTHRAGAVQANEQAHVSGEATPRHHTFARYCRFAEAEASGLPSSRASIPPQDKKGKWRFAVFAPGMRKAACMGTVNSSCKYSLTATSHDDAR